MSQRLKNALRSAREWLWSLVKRGQALARDSRDRVRAIAAVVRRAYHRVTELLEVPWSVQSVVRRDEAEWSAFNRHRRAFALSRIQRELLFAGEHPVRFSVSLSALVASAWTLAQVLPPDWFVASWGS